MHASLFLLPFIALSSALPSLAPRQGQEDKSQLLLNEISQLGVAVQELDADVKMFDGSPFTALPQGYNIIRSAMKVDDLIKQSTKTAKESSPFTMTESRNVLIALAGQIDPIMDTLNTLKMKYPQFKQTFTTSIVLMNLKTLKGDTNSFLAAVREKETAEDAGLLDLGKDQLNKSFDEAIAVYSQ